MLELAGVADAAAKAACIMTLETEIAATHSDKVSLRDPQKTYNLMTAKQTRQLLPEVGIWLDALGVTAQQHAEMVVATPEFFKGQQALLKQDRCADWQA